MPLYELYQLAKEKPNSEEINSTCAADQSSAPDNDFFELVLENGQIYVQGRSSRARKSPTCKTLPFQCVPSHSLTDRDKDVGCPTTTNTRLGKFGDLEAGLNEIPMPLLLSGEVDLNPDEDVMMPWLNYAMDDSFQQEYSSDFLHELSGVTINELPPSNNFTLLDKRNYCNQVFRDSHKNLTPFASVRSRVSDATVNITGNATAQHATCGDNITQIPSSSSGFSSLKMEKQDPMMSSNSISTMMNFSHFARPAAIVQANLQSIARSENLGNKNKGGAGASRSNPPESTFVDSSGECPKESTKHLEVMEPSKGDLKQLEQNPVEQNTAASKQSDSACKEDASRIDQTCNEVHGESGSKGQEDVKKIMEPAVASSSVCSGNGAERDSDHPTQNLKRKSRDTEDSEWHSEDVEEDSVGVKKAAPARSMGSKRSRAAEVHNLSERRRRDRINEKMRALQELVPNCNKVDKASMLDEAIEYLKTLQLQVQIMSMGAGLYMSPMMFPAGMQYMHAPHLAPFSPMGVGMQMGLGVGYGMGLQHDINGGSSRFPMVQLPQIQGTHLPVANMSGPNGTQEMARPNSQVFGHPAPMPMPPAPVFSFSGGPLLNSPALGGQNVYGTAGLMETVGSASASGLKDLMPNVNSQVIQSTGVCNPTNQMSS